MKSSEHAPANPRPASVASSSSAPALGEDLSLSLDEPGLTGPASTPVRAALLRRAQQGYGNAAVGRLLQRDATATVTPPTTAPAGPKIVDIGGEKVEVKDDAEKAEAERIIKDIKDKYGIEISSLKGVEGVKKHYDKAPEAVRTSVKASTWKLKELKALERALARFAPILGKERAASTRKDADQEVTTAGKVEESITANKPTGTLDPNTLGEYFRDSKTFDLFDPGTEAEGDFPGDNPKQLEGTAIHEIAHGLLKYALPDYVKGLAFWRDESTKSGTAGAEAPITDYGAKSAAEDLSEAVMIYFLDPERLKKGDGKENGTPGNPCPKRFALIDGFVKAWKADKK